MDYIITLLISIWPIAIFAIIVWLVRQPKTEEVLTLGQVTVIRCTPVKLRDDFEMPPKHKLWKAQGKVI